MQDLYMDFAERYDIPYGQPDQPDAQMMDFFRRLFGKYNVRRVLDCACGTGRHLLWLGKLGFERYTVRIYPLPCLPKQGKIWQPGKWKFTCVI